MRTIVAVILAFSILILGFQAVGIQMDSADTHIAETNTTNATDDAYNISSGVYEAVGEAGSQAVPWVGVAAIVLVSLGFLAFAWRGGGR